MKNKLSIFLCIFFFVVGYIGFQSYKLQNKLSKSSPFADDNIVKSAPDVKFKKQFEEGEVSFLDSFDRDAIVIVHFWATWCVPCLKELPEFFSFSESLKNNKKFKVMAISIDDKPSEIKKFFSKLVVKKPSNIIFLSDMTGAHKYFGSYKLPETFVFDGNGRLLKKLSGAQKWQDESFSIYLRSLSTKIETVK